MINKNNFFGGRPTAMDDFFISNTKKKYLEILDVCYVSSSLSSKALTTPVFYYANDASYLSYYIAKCYGNPRTASHIRSPNEPPLLGAVIGNGYILSMLPDLCVDDVLLIDCESAVHYFILKVRELILQVDLNDDFELLKLKLMNQIQLVEDQLNLSNRDSWGLALSNEMLALGDRHFLASKSRFIQCREALETKDLLPIQANIFHIWDLKLLGNRIRDAGCVISFLNLTNVAEYDDEYNSLYHCIEQLPLAAEFTILSTRLLSSQKSCHVSTDLKTFKSLNNDEEKNKTPRSVISHISSIFSSLFTKPNIACAIESANVRQTLKHTI